MSNLNMEGKKDWFFRGTRVRNWDGTDVAFLTINPKYKLDEDQIADGKLMAAAPDMLYALKDILAQFEEDEYDMHNACWAKVKAAIKYAEEG